VPIFGCARIWLLVDRRYAFVSGERASGGLALNCMAGRSLDMAKMAVGLCTDHSHEDAMISIIDSSVTEPLDVL
jgi:hypothetical protein